MLPKTAYERGKKDDEILIANLLDRLRPHIPGGDLTAYESESLKDLRPRVVAFEQLAAQKIVDAKKVKDTDCANLAPALMGVAREAGKSVSAYFNARTASDKPEDINVPSAQARADALAIVCAGLARVKNRYGNSMPIVTDMPSDQTAYGLRLHDQWWLVNPMSDSKNDDTAISIALIDKGKPIVGIVHFPQLERTYGGIPDKEWAVVQTKKRIHPIGAKSRDEFSRVAFAMRQAYDATAYRTLRDAHRIQRIRERTGAPYGLCRLAQGSCDFYFHPALIPQASLAGAYAVAVAAGGTILTTQGQDIRFGLTPQPFVAASNRDMLQFKVIKQLSLAA